MAKILIVDDRPANRQFLSTLLGYGGHELYEAADGAEALRLTREKRPDLVITDILMPTMDGFEYAKTVRAEPEIAATRIIFYTATYRANEASLLAKACGVSVVIAKPAEPQRVLDVVSEQLGLAPLQVVPRKGEKPPKAVEEDEPELSRLGVELADHVNDLRGLRAQFDAIVERSKALEKERDRLRGISTRFSETTARLHSSSARLYALVEVGMDLVGERDPQKLLQTYASSSRRILGARTATVLVLRATEDMPRYVACEGLDPAAAAAMRDMALEGGLVRELLTQRKVIRLSAPGGVEGLPAGHPPAKSFLGVVIGSLGSCYGVAFYADKIGAEFDQDDERAAQVLASELAVTYENFELYDVLQKRAADLQLEVSERRRVQAELAESNTRFRQMAETIRDVFFLVEAGSGRTLYVNPAYEQVFGRSCESLYEQPGSWMESVHPEDRERIGREYASSIAVGMFEFEYRIVRPDGGVRWIRVRGFPVNDAGGALQRLVGIASDITEQKLADLRIRHLNRVYAVLSGINMLIVRCTDQDELLRGACRIAVEDGGFSVAWAGLIDREGSRISPAAWRGVDEAYMADLSAELNRPGGKGLVRLVASEKRAVVVNDIAAEPRLVQPGRVLQLGSRSLVALPLVVGGEAVGLLVLHAREKDFFTQEEMRLLDELAGDVSFAIDHIAKAKQLDYLAYYDSLTGLANGALFNERLQQTIREAKDGRAALFLIDVERFKLINDTLGRTAGDALLRQVAERMVAKGGDASRMARIGADQFATMVGSFESGEQLARFTRKRLSEVFGPPFKVGEHEVRLSAKVGIALSPENGGTPDALYASAEAALKKAKAGSEPYLFFAPEMTARVHERLMLETQLRSALERGELVLHYQPKVATDSREIVGVEALLRWQSPGRGLVPPAQFIGLLEETGLIVPAGAWALQQAARDQRAWAERGLRAPRVAVNVSAVQLRQKDFVEMVRQAIRGGVSPVAIDVELTESMLMQDVEASIAKLKALREAGMQISIDDFGTGYSSLGYLARLPVHALKIDRSFTVAMIRDPDATTLVSTMISLGHSLRLKVVAEGVETEEQANMLRLLRCDEMQGYLISRPVPADALAALLPPGEAARAAAQPARL